MMKNTRRLAVAVVCFLLTPPINAQNPAAPSPQPSTVLFHNARVFDGVKDTLSEPSDVLVQGNKITKIPTTPITPDPDSAQAVLM
jgi:hypothetical protein